MTAERVYDGIASDVAELEDERDQLFEALTDLVAYVREVHVEHAPHDGTVTCLRCQADRLAEENHL